MSEMRGLLLEWRGLTPPGRTEAPTFWDYWRGRDDPRVAQLEAELRFANLKVQALETEKGRLEARIKVLELRLSTDPEAMRARREQHNREVDEKVAAMKEADRDKAEKALRERDEAERKDPTLRQKRERREREDREWMEEQTRRDRVHPPFGGQPWGS